MTEENKELAIRPNESKDLVAQDDDLFFMKAFTDLSNKLIEVSNVDKAQAQATYEIVNRIIGAIERQYTADWQQYEWDLQRYNELKKLFDEGKISKADLDSAKPHKPKRPNLSDYLQDLNNAMKNNVDSTQKLVDIAEMLAKIFVKKTQLNGRNVKVPEKVNATQINIDQLRINLLDQRQNDNEKKE